jgi:hypothetical protein
MNATQLKKTYFLKSSDYPVTHQEAMARPNLVFFAHADATNVDWDAFGDIQQATHFYMDLRETAVRDQNPRHAFEAHCFLTGVDLDWLCDDFVQWKKHG